jgi:hypothetical protein
MRTLGSVVLRRFVQGTAVLPLSEMGKRSGAMLTGKDPLSYLLLATRSFAFNNALPFFSFSFFKLKHFEESRLLLKC